MTKSNIDKESIRSLATLLEENNLTEIEYKVGDIRIKVARNSTPISLTPSSNNTVTIIDTPTTSKDTSDLTNHPGTIKSPMVGIAYLSHEPNAPNFINVGDTVVEGQTLLIIEAMKTFNTIHSPKNGLVEAILIENGQPLEFGEPMLIIS
ncbi:MAG: acetyl-CoA carboxylase biotin carboxyl carrier protein [Rhodospirillaceae bacterium]|jgi:acetyl-CoA carboxylase biotin carboxyl carrier protein|nr:acetyl-CoA carboxylase biotin carboxyl carrier protein [Rhodospirillaceae bacterium]